MILASLFMFVLLPAAAGIVYLYGWAANQYHSVVGFSVRSEELESPLSILESFTSSGTANASDSDILYEYIRSQQLVEEVNEDLDLEKIFNRPEGDPLFTLGENPTIEDLHWYWGWMVSLSYDSGTGILEVESRAFTPEDATAISQAIVDRSTALINALSEEARLDAIRYAEQDLREAEEHLKDIQVRMLSFRNTEQMVDPAGDVEARMGVLTGLETQLAQALVQRDMLAQYAGESDSRLIRLNDQIAAIERRIENEKSKLGGSGGALPLASTIGEYEELLLDRGFAEQAYTAVLAAFQQARAEARRQHRYLAAHISPTTAQDSLYPQRWLLALAGTLLLFAVWATGLLIVFNIKDRR